jgi:orotate phosphoribosyltransferase
LISTGGSSLKAVEALREVGCDVKGMAAIFTYEFPKAVESFKKAECRLVTLSNYSTLLLQAVDSKFIKESDIEHLATWRKAPELWGK